MKKALLVLDSTDWVLECLGDVEKMKKEYENRLVFIDKMKSKAFDETIGLAWHRVAEKLIEMNIIESYDPSNQALRISDGVLYLVDKNDIEMPALLKHLLGI